MGIFDFFKHKDYNKKNKNPNDSYDSFGFLLKEGKKIQWAMN